MSEPEIPPELEEDVEIKIALAGLESPGDEKRLSATLAQLHGIRESSLSDRVLSLRYDPTLTTHTKISSQLEKDGFACGATEIANASPIVDAFH